MTGSTRCASSTSSSAAMAWRIPNRAETTGQDALPGRSRVRLAGPGHLFSLAELRAAAPLQRQRAFRARLLIRSGYNRVYVFLDEPFSAEAWWVGLRAGRVTAGNGPLLQPWVDGQRPGHVFESPRQRRLRSSRSCPYLSAARTDSLPRSGSRRDGGQHPEARRIRPEAGKLLPLTFEESGWFLIRAVSDVSTPADSR